MKNGRREEEEGTENNTCIDRLQRVPDVFAVGQDPVLAQDLGGLVEVLRFLRSPTISMAPPFPLITMLLLELASSPAMTIDLDVAISALSIGDAGTSHDSRNLPHSR
jgi:hypothetical protein